MENIEVEEEYGFLAKEDGWTEEHALSVHFLAWSQRARDGTQGAPAIYLDVCRCVPTQW